MAIQLRQEEQIQYAGKIHWSAMLLAATWAAFIGIGILGQLTSERKEQNSPVIPMLLMGGLPLLYSWLKNKSKVYVITNQRLYVETGILAKSKVDIPFHKINDITFNQGLTQRMFGSGNIAVMTGNDKPTILYSIDDAEKFRESLSSICHRKTA